MSYMARVKMIIFLIFGTFFLQSCSILSTSPQYKIVWADEFEFDGYPDENKWSYDLGDGCPVICRWGNNESQYYTKNLHNAKVDKGHLTITAIKEDIYSYHYTSSRLVTKNKGDWTYGKIEVKAKLPSGKGMWPAIWMLPTDNFYGGWPKSGEIDIVEYVGHIPDSIFATTHTESFRNAYGTHNTKSVYIPDATTNFHIYGMEWDEEKIMMTVDGKKYFTMLNSNNGYQKWPFDKRFHLILNIAVGGYWGATKGIDDFVFPQSMVVDYVRIYQKIM